MKTIKATHKTSNSNFLKTLKTTTTMRTSTISNQVKSSLFFKAGLESFYNFSENFLLGRSGRPFRAVPNYHLGVRKGFAHLNLTKKESETTNLQTVLLWQLRLSDLLKNSTHPDASAILCAFKKYVGFIIWLNNTPGSNMPIVCLAPISPKLPTQTYAMAA